MGVDALGCSPQEEGREGVGRLPPTPVSAQMNRFEQVVFVAAVVCDCMLLLRCAHA